MNEACSCGGCCGDGENVQLFHLYEVKILLNCGEEKTRIVPVKCEKTTDKEIEEEIKYMLKGELKITSFKRFDPNNIGNIDN